MLWGVFKVFTYIYLVVSICSVCCGSWQTAHTIISVDTNIFELLTMEFEQKMLAYRFAGSISQWSGCLPHLIYIHNQKSWIMLRSDIRKYNKWRWSSFKGLALSSLNEGVVVHLLRLQVVLWYHYGLNANRGSFGWWAKSGRMKSI